MMPNKSDAPNPAIAPRFHAGRHRRRVGDPGRWANMQRAFIIMVLAVLLAGCTRSKHVKVALTTLPQTNHIVMRAGDSCEFQLPSGNTVAIWCVHPRSPWMSGDEDVDSRSGLKTIWGERPFRRPEEILVKAATNGYDVVGWKSYITRISATLRGSQSREYVLIADKVSFIISEDLTATNSLPVTISVRR